MSAVWSVLATRTVVTGVDYLSTADMTLPRSLFKEPFDPRAMLLTTRCWYVLSDSGQKIVIVRGSRYQHYLPFPA